MSEYNKSQPVIHDLLTQTENKSGLIGTSSSTITFAQEIDGLEIVNHSTTNTIYIEFSGAAATVTASLPIYPRQYYSCNRKMTTFKIISDSASTDVRIMGHFAYDALN